MLKITSKYYEICKGIVFWLVTTLLIFIPLYQKFPLINIPGTFVAVRLEDILIFVTFVAWVLLLTLSKDWKKFFGDKLVQAIIVFFAIGFISYLSGVLVTKTISAQVGLFHFIRRIELILLMPISIWAVRSKKDVYFWLFLSFFVLLLVNFYALGQKFLGFPAISTTSAEASKGIISYLSPSGRVNSTFAGHYDLAIYLMMNISLFAGLIFYFVDNPKFKTLRQKLTLSAVFLGLAALSFVVLVMTAARLSFIGVFLAIFLALILLKKWKFILVMFVFAIATLIYPSQLRSRLISTFTVNLASTWKSYTAISEEQVQRSNLNIPTLPSSGRGQDAPGLVSPDIAPGEPVDITDLGVYRSFSIRIYAEWPRAFRAFIKNPLLGTGYSSIGLATDNDVLRSLGEVGLLGTAAFALIIWELIKRVVVNVKKGRKFNKYFSVGVLAMIAAFLVNSLFIDVFEATKVASMFWLINGVYLGYNRRKV